jgi:hypothetical protein
VIIAIRCCATDPANCQSDELTVRVGTIGCGVESDCGDFEQQQCEQQGFGLAGAEAGDAKENCPATSAMLKSRAINGFAIFRRLLVFLFGGGDFLHVFIGIFHEVFFAIFAAHFDFLAFVNKGVRLHVAARDVFIGHDAFFQRIGLGLFVRLSVVGVNVECAEAQGNRGNQGVNQFHIRILIR